MLPLVIAIAQLATAEAVPKVPAVDGVARLREAIAASVRERMGANTEVIVNAVETLTDGDSDWAIVRPAPDTRLGPRMRFLLLTRRGIDGATRLLATGTVIADVQVALEHAHARHGLTRGRDIGGDDVTVVRHDIGAAALRRWPTPAEVEGARALRDLPADACIGPGSVVAQPAVRTGQTVVAISRVAGVEATATLVAAASGHEGAVIRVVNPDSRRALRARVVSAGIVEIIHD
jgi:flagella basal body P-ring formation protein FlgA